MPAFTATAPGKIILFGEHSVVYGQPALAAPVFQVRAKATVTADIGAPAGRVWIEAPDINLRAAVDSLDANHAFSRLLTTAKEGLGIAQIPAIQIKVTSTIPIAAGLGSGAAVAVATIRALAGFLGKAIPNEQIAAMAYEAEKSHHGTPSGIDNTVIACEQPIFFIKNQPIERLPIPMPFTLVIASTGVRSSTAEVVAGVRQRRETNPEKYNLLFDRAGKIAIQARKEILQGNLAKLGPLMNENHTVLQEMGVSSDELDQLVEAARAAGAAGAKLSGAGQGGNMIALVMPESATRVRQALADTGAREIIITTVQLSMAVKQPE